MSVNSKEETYVVKLIMEVLIILYANCCTCVMEIMWDIPLSLNRWPNQRLDIYHVQSFYKPWAKIPTYHKPWPRVRISILAIGKRKKSSRSKERNKRRRIRSNTTLTVIANAPTWSTCKQPHHKLGGIQPNSEKKSSKGEWQERQKIPRFYKKRHKSETKD